MQKIILIVVPQSLEKQTVYVKSCINLNDSILEVIL